jgi:hypothetical protein
VLCCRWEFDPQIDPFCTVTPLDDLSACGRVLGCNGGGLADSWTGCALDGHIHRVVVHNVAKRRDLNGILTIVDRRAQRRIHVRKALVYLSIAEGFRFRMKNKSQKLVK